MGAEAITTAQWVGFGLFVVALVLLALSLGLAGVLGWGYGIVTTLEGGAFVAAGVAVTFGRLPLIGAQPIVLSATLASVAAWHIAMISVWPLPHRTPTR